MQRGLKRMEGLHTQEGALEELPRQLYCLVLLYLSEFTDVDGTPLSQ